MCVRRAVSLVLVLLVCGCSALPGEAGPLEASSALTITTGTERAGVKGLQLGDTYTSVMGALAAGSWQPPECESGRTAFRGTGRLFMIDQCSAVAASEVRLAESVVARLSLIFLDEQLVRLDIELKDRLASTAQILQETLDGNFAPGESPDHWQRGDDRVRLLDDVQLQMIDGRLENKMPSLFASRFNGIRQ